MPKVTGDEFLTLIEQTPSLGDWRPLLGTLRARYATGSFVAGLTFVSAITDAAEKANHHPDVTLTYPHVEISLQSHDVGHITDRDVALAARIAEIAREQGVEADPDAVQLLEIGLDTWDWREIKPFWCAVYGVEDPDPEADEVEDPAGVLPPIWFQETDEHAEPRMRFHLDVTVPLHVLESRVGAAVAAGGRVVDDGPSPRFVVLADPQDNRVCLCTHAGRSV